MNTLTKIISGIVILYTAGSFAMDNVPGLNDNERCILMLLEKREEERNFRSTACNTIMRRNCENASQGLPIDIIDEKNIAFKMQKRDSEKTI